MCVVAHRGDVPVEMLLLVRRGAASVARRASSLSAGDPLALELTPRARVEAEKGYDAIVIGAGHNGLTAVRASAALREIGQRGYAGGTLNRTSEDGRP